MNRRKRPTAKDKYPITGIYLTMTLLSELKRLVLLLNQNNLDLKHNLSSVIREACRDLLQKYKELLNKKDNK